MDLPMPIRTPRLLIRPREPGDAAVAYAAIQETWVQLHRWMAWAGNPDQLTQAFLEARTRQAMAESHGRTTLELLGLEIASGTPVVWCGLHDIDWQAQRCDTGFWVRGS